MIITRLRVQKQQTYEYSLLISYRWHVRSSGIARERGAGGEHMATDYESLAAIFYNASLVGLVYFIIVYFFLYRLLIRPWIVRGVVWERLVNNTDGGISTNMLQSYMRNYSLSSGRTWLMAAEIFEDIAHHKENKFKTELANQFPNIASISDPSERHKAMRLIPDQPYFPYYVTARMNSQHLNEKSGVFKWLKKRT